MNKLKNNAGVTLIEILIGVVISVIIMAAMYASYTVVNSSYSKVTDKAKASQSGRNIMGMIMRDVRQAGFRYFEDNIANSDEPVRITEEMGGPEADQISDCDHIRIVFGGVSYDDNDDEVYERYRITYFCRASEISDPAGNAIATNAIYKQKERLVDGAWDMGIDIAGSYEEQLITDYVENLIFIPKDENGEAIFPPPTNDPANMSQSRVYDIRAIEIGLTTRSSKDFYRDELRADGSARTIFNMDDDEVESFNDRFLRETVVMSVNTRNIGLK